MAYSDAEIVPPPFLSPFEAMKDVYFRARGRTSNKVRELLESPELEDLVSALKTLHEDEKLLRHPEGRHRRQVLAKLGADSGPLVVGFGDPRLNEPWRLFLEGWEIWVPDKGSGVELFWEGEAEDDDSDEPVEILQSLTLVGTELTLEVRVGPASDRITFDGKSFFRLKAEG